MLYALLRNSVCVEIQDLTPGQLQAVMNDYQLIVPIEGVTPVPQVGWRFTGHRLEPDLPVQPDHIKIYRLLDEPTRSRFSDLTVPPFGLNYKTGLLQRLQFKDTKNFGRIVTREYFAESVLNPDGSVTLSDKVIQEDYTYVYSEFGDVFQRTITIRWLREDGTFHPEVKDYAKYYTVNPEELLEEASKVRRSFANELKVVLRRYAVDSIIANAQIPPEVLTQTGGNALLAAELVAIQFLDDNTSRIESFITVGSPGLLESIQGDATHVWLDNEFQPGLTFRQYLVNQLSTYMAGGAS